MQSLEGDLDSAEKTLTLVQARLQNLRAIEGRLQYQISSLLAVMGIGIFCTLIVLFAGIADRNPLLASRLAMVCGFGAIGGFLSISIGINKLQIDPDADWKINAIAGVSRIVIAVIGSLFVYLAIVSKLILGTLSITDSDAGILTVSLVAGFSETLVPNILGRLANRADETGSDKTE